VLVAGSADLEPLPGAPVLLQSQDGKLPLIKF
jgi:hypothetical protein